jgi:cyclic-di-GMP-binding protein
MPSFDVSSEINWQSMDDAINQTLKEVRNRYDFKGIQTDIVMDEREKTLKITCSEGYKMDAVQEVFHQKLVKRGISLLSLDYQPEEKASGSGARVVAKVAAGVSKEKGKEIIAFLKKEMKKVQAQIQDEKVRVMSKNRDDLQAAIALLRAEEDKLGVPMQFGNFRD